MWARTMLRAFGLNVGLFPRKTWTTSRWFRFALKILRETHIYRRLYEIYATQINYIFYLSSMNNTREVFLTMYTMTSEIHQEVCFVFKSTRIVSD